MWFTTHECENALFISPNLRKDLHTWCTLTLIMGLLPLSTMAYGNNLQVAVKFPHHNHHFNDSHLIQSLSRIPSSSMLFRQLQNVFSGCLQPGLFFFIEFRFPKTTTFMGKRLPPGNPFLCLATWCLSAPWNPWSGAQSNASHQRVSLAPRAAKVKSLGMLPIKYVGTEK